MLKLIKRGKSRSGKEFRVAKSETSTNWNRKINSLRNAGQRSKSEAPIWQMARPLSLSLSWHSRRWTIVECTCNRWTWWETSASIKTTKCSSLTSCRPRSRAPLNLTRGSISWSIMDRGWTRRCKISSITLQQRLRTQSCLSHLKTTRKNSITWRRSRPWRRWRTDWLKSIQS